MIKTNLQWTRLGNMWTAAVNGTLAMHVARKKQYKNPTQYEAWIEDMDAGKRLLECRFHDTRNYGTGWARMKAVNMLYNLSQKDAGTDIQTAIRKRKLKTDYARNPETAPYVDLKTALRLIGCIWQHDSVEIAESGMEMLDTRFLTLKQIRETMDMKRVRVIAIKQGFSGMRLITPWPEK